MASLRAGDSAPDFFLTTTTGVEVGLTACLLEGPVLLDFIRGTWDPDSRKRLKLLSAQRERLREAKARAFIITCERPGPAARYLEGEPCSLPVLVDHDRRVARAYGVLQRWSLPIWNIARPSSFVVDRCGFVRFAYVAPLQIHSADLEEVLRVLRAL
jgi:peroxiredoxin